MTREIADSPWDDDDTHPTFISVSFFYQEIEQDKKEIK